jgi:Ca2+-transporting ATPase
MGAGSKENPVAAVPWYSRSAAWVAKELRVDPQQGLSSTDAAGRLRRDGPNLLAEVTQRSLLQIFVHQFKSLIVALLVVAGGVALLLGQTVESIAILVVIGLNALIGFATEWKAARSLAGLRKQAVPVARVRRDSVELHVPAADLVQGDIVLLASGDRTPADGRIIEDAQLQVDESSLTGESVAVTKTAEPVQDRLATLADQNSMVHMGTPVTTGRGAFIVTAAGMNTEVGRIGTLIDEAGDRRTPLEAKLAQLSRALLVIVLVLCVVIIVAGWLRGNELLFMVEVGVSLAIAAVPEGLLAVTTMTLAVGMQRMARMNALVRRLPAVEALGSATVICTDKTGTLTRNEMTVRAFDVASKRIEVTGTGYALNGEFRIDGRRVDTTRTDADDSLGLALRIGALCNDATIDISTGVAVVLGDPTEAALIVAAEKGGLQRSALELDYPRIAEQPFSSESQRMVTVHRKANGRAFACVKGAPSAVLSACASRLEPGGVSVLSDVARKEVLSANEDLASAALRVLGLAFRELPEVWADDDLTRELTWVGLVGMIDPLRDNASETIATCRQAGIRTIMITGDQLATAAEIARQLGLDCHADGTTLSAVHGRELGSLDSAGWLAIVDRASVFARVSPEHKLRIVDALQQQGNVVAMTGDGVNDAPALRKSDIGIAMGIRGTEVAKDAADMVITDDNFATIINAVEQGRIIVQNILRFIHYLFSSNLAEILTVFSAIMIGWPLPLGVLQILWLNLVTDIFPAMALALEPSTPDAMKSPPRDPKASLMTPRFGWLILWQGALLSICTLLAFAAGMRWYGDTGDGLVHAKAIAFMTLAIAQVFHAFNVRSHTQSVFATGMFKNGWLWGATFVCLGLQLVAAYVPLLNRVLQTVPLTASDWALVMLCSATPVVVVELVKLIGRWRRPESRDGW